MISKIHKVRIVEVSVDDVKYYLIEFQFKFFFIKFWYLPEIARYRISTSDCINRALEIPTLAEANSIIRRIKKERLYTPSKISKKVIYTESLEI